MRTTCFFFSWKLATSFSIFSIFILSGKKSKSLWSSCNLSGYWTSTSKISYITIFVVVSYKIFTELRCYFNPLKAVYKQCLCHFQSIQIINVPVIKIRWFFTFAIVFHVFIINFRIVNICILLNYFERLYIQDNTHNLVFNSTRLAFFIIMSIFTFNLMNSYSKIITKFDNYLAINLGLSINCNL